jgi:hypothetical protein
MKRVLELGPFLLIVAYMALGRMNQFMLTPMRWITLVISCLALPLFWGLHKNKMLSSINKALLGYLLFSFAAFWMAPQNLGIHLAAMPAPILYAVALLTVAVPPLFGAELFTYYYSRQTASPRFQRTQAFKRTNQLMTGFWIMIFTVNICVSLIPNIYTMVGHQRVFTLLIPLSMLLILGVPVTKLYPERQERKALRALRLEVAD